MECVAKLENTTYFYSLIMEILYASSFAFIGLVINRVGKITILCKYGESALKLVYFSLTTNFFVHNFTIHSYFYNFLHLMWPCCSLCCRSIDCGVSICALLFGRRGNKCLGRCHS